MDALKEARSDHYDGENGIYRLSAYVEISKESNISQLQNLLKELSSEQNK